MSGKNLLPKKIMIKTPSKTVKTLIKKLEIMLVPKICLAGYFPLPRKKTAAELKPKPVNTNNREGNKIATEYMPCPLGPKDLAIITVIKTVKTAVATRVKNVISVFLVKVPIIFDKNS